MNVETKKSDEIRCLLLPLQQQTLILPYAAVAEVVPLQGLPAYQLLPNTPNWVLGKIVWQGLEIPLISLELMDQYPEENENFTMGTQIAVLNRAGEAWKVPFIGIVAQGIPRLCRCKQEELKLISACLEPYYKMLIEVRGTEAFIPDLAWVGQEVYRVFDIA